MEVNKTLIPLFSFNGRMFYVITHQRRLDESRVVQPNCNFKWWL